MNAAGPVLRDIHLPPAAWWPLAPGWWLLAGVLLLLALVAIAWWRRMRTPPLLAAALREIDDIAARYARERDAIAVVDASSRLLRRIALRIQPAIASASGDAWRGFVHAHARDAMTQGTLDTLLQVRYRPQPHPDVPALLQALRSWCTAALPAPSLLRRSRA